MTLSTRQLTRDEINGAIDDIAKHRGQQRGLYRCGQEVEYRGIKYAVLDAHAVGDGFRYCLVGARGLLVDGAELPSPAGKAVQA